MARSNFSKAQARAQAKANRAAAQAWLCVGLPVFPVDPATKIPVAPWRPGGRPLDLDTALSAWADKDWLHPMPGLDCESAGVVVFDCDNRPDRDGVKAFGELCARLGASLAGALQVETPSGGRHYFFADPEGRFRNSASLLAPGVDTRGVGGYVAAAGAVRADRHAYEPRFPATLDAFIATIAERRCPPLPEALAALLTAGRRARPTTRRSPSTVGAVLAGASMAKTPPLTESALLDDLPGDWDDLSAGLSERWTLDGALASVASAVPGTRNDTFAREAFTAGLRASALGLDPDQTVDALVEAARIAGSDDAKTVDTFGRCFEAGMARAEQAAAAAAPVSALAPAGGAPNWTAAHELQALRVAKSRLRDAFLIAHRLGRHRIRSDLVRVCMAVPDASVRAKLMFALSAFLMKSNHSFEEIVGAVIACGFPRAHAAHAFVWAQKNVMRGDVA